MSNDWLDDMLADFISEFASTKDNHLTLGEFIVDSNSKQQILNYISKHYVTKKECRKHVIKARLAEIANSQAQTMLAYHDAVIKTQDCRTHWQQQLKELSDE